MTFFLNQYIRPFLATYGRHRLLEIGGSEGKHSDLLMTLPGASLTIIDPCLDKPLGEIYSDRDVSK
jgi:hypothetical protein